MRADPGAKYTMYVGSLANDKILEVTANDCLYSLENLGLSHESDPFVEKVREVFNQQKLEKDYYDTPVKLYSLCHAFIERANIIYAQLT